MPIKPVGTNPRYGMAYSSHAPLLLNEQAATDPQLQL